MKPPRVGPMAARKTEARLKQFGDQLRDGNMALLKRLTHPWIGQVGRGQVPAPTHYLPANRFEWWQADSLVPPTGPIDASKHPEASSFEEVFYTEFRSPLATVVGADLSAVGEMTPRRLSWDDLVEGASPNLIGGIELRIPSRPPASIPNLHVQRISRVGGPAADRLVLVNTAAGGADPGPEGRAGLVIDFAVAQRAVGLECGFIGAAELQLRARDIALVARDENGAEIVSSTGSSLSAQDWRANTVFLIGVCDRQGRILSVELQYRGDPPRPVEPQFVLRIWHEPLPPVAVLQGELDGERGFKLPFRCDRAVAFLRGFKLNYPEGYRTRPIQHIGAGVSTDAPFVTEPGGAVTLRPSGMLSPGGTNQPPFVVKIYFTLLAWSAEQVDLVAAKGFLSDQGSPAQVPMDLPDRVLVEGQMPATGDTRTEQSGPLFGALTSFRLSLREPKELDQFAILVGQTNGFERATYERHGGFGMVPSNQFRNPRLNYNGERISFENYTNVGDAVVLIRSLEGIVLNGHGLVLNSGFRLPPLSLPTVEERKAGEFVLDFEPFSSVAWPIECDMPFVAASIIAFDMDAEVKELEAEVIGSTYEGMSAGWRAGYGIDIQPLISGGGYIGPNFKRLALAAPNLAGVVRRAVAPFLRLMAQAATFEALTGLVTLAPAAPGALVNLGNVPILVTQALVDGPDAAMFNLRLEHRGVVLLPNEVEGQGPLELRPNEAIVVGGRFFTAGRFDPGDPPRQAWIDFRTNDAAISNPRVQIEARGLVSNPAGNVLPNRIDFGFVVFQAPPVQPAVRTRNVIIDSRGTTPLLIREARLEDETIGFTIGLLEGGGIGDALALDVAYQIEPGDSLIFQVRFTAERLGRAETGLVLDSNVGSLRVSLFAEVVAA